MPKNRSHGTPEQFEQAVRQRIEELSGGVESTTAITADTDESGLFADPNGVIGDAGELYTYQELKKMYDDGIADDDQWFVSYPTFEQWYRQIVLGYLTRVTSEAGLVDDDDEDLGPWEFLGSKQVMDSDGFWTDYTLWVNHETGMYVCIFGDSDLYTPENSSPDFETDSEFEAYEWFNDYDTGELEGEDDIYDEIHSSTNPRRNPILGKDSGMENPSYVSLILDTIPYVLKDGGIADEVTKVGHADGNIVFTFKKDGDTYTARFPEHELTGRDHDDLPDDEWLIEDAARDAIAGISAATNTCGVAAKPVVGAEVLYVDDGGVLGEPGAQYNYDELYNMFVDNWDYDPVMVDYDTFDAWFKDTKPYLRIVKSSSQIKADLSEVPDVTEVVIEGSEDDSWEDVPSDVSSTDIRSDVYNALSDIGFRYHSKGIELTQADFQDAFDFFMLKYFDSDSNE